MKVILLKDIKGLGRRFEEKNVSDGYALNSLIPKKFAVPAGSSAAAQIKHLKEQEEKSRAKEQEKVAENISKIAGIELRLAQKANEKNHLFASLNAQKLSEMIKTEKGIEIDPDCIALEHPIKELGTFSIPVHVPGGKETHFTLILEGK